MYLKEFVYLCQKHCVIIENQTVMKRLLITMQICLWGAVIGMAQPFDVPTEIFLKHSSGNIVTRKTSDDRAILSAPADGVKALLFIPDGTGYYTIQDQESGRFMTRQGSWNTYFLEDSTSDNAKYAIEKATTKLYRLKCKSNSKYLGTDSNNSGAYLYSDKSGDNTLHHWFFTTNPIEELPVDTISYLVQPELIRQHFDGWGVSLCWWANMCGRWSDQKIDEIVDWLVSPTGLNFRIFRYNIGGGDDPQNRNCTAHHMASGKGVRAEMEGFKDSPDDDYHWDRDAAQRKIMLKIKEKRPDAVFEAFSNSAPYYMTYSGCVAGNTNANDDNLRPEYYEEFAHYLVDVCVHYRDVYGIEFKTLEPFNEPVTNYWYAGGSQEGCHFGLSAQVAFLKVLSPILKVSGLNTVISASDETSVSQSVTDLKRYVSDGIVPLIGQWNAHTYTANIQVRTQLAQLAYDQKVPLWMSEVGAGGSGIAGNLSLAQKLIDDMRYMQPETWVDWQYVEENNEQWCLVRGNFSNQTYSKVKNYSVRQQFSRFIREGYDIITSLNNQTVAALNAMGDTLVLVVLNEGGEATHQADLTAFSSVNASGIQAYRTTSGEDCKQVTGFYSYDEENRTLNYTIPAQSVITFVIPLTAAGEQPTERIRTDAEYLVIPRMETTQAMTAGTDERVTIENISMSPEQIWTLIPTGDADKYVIQNKVGQKLTGARARNSATLNALTDDADEQTFTVQAIDGIHYKILSAYDPTNGLDLASEKTTSGTRVDLWEYGTTSTPTHRQWLLVPLPKEKQAEEDVIRGDVNEDGNVDINDVVAIINHMAETAFWRYADVNEDEKVDINDVVAVINIMAER